MLEDAGIDPATLADLEWNPDDGGSFEETMAALSVDANGVHGNEDGFDASNVATYGFGLVGAGAGNGRGRPVRGALTGASLASSPGSNSVPVLLNRPTTWRGTRHGHSQSYSRTPVWRCGDRALPEVSRASESGRSARYRSLEPIVEDVDTGGSVWRPRHGRAVSWW